jgi:hypothetical protein
MQYMLMAYVNEGGWATMSKTEQEQGMAAAYAEALTKAGIVKGSNRLRPAADATVVRAARAELLAKTGAYDEARRAYEIATGLERDPAVRAFLQRRQAALPD